MKIVVAHPHRLIAESIADSLSSGGGYDTSSISDVSSLQAIVKELRPSVVIVSALLFDGEGGLLIDEIKSYREDLAVVIISSGTGSDEFMWALKAGATGYVALETGTVQLVETINKVADGEVVVAGVERRQASSPGNEEADPASGEKMKALGSLTPREREVLNLLAKGFSNRQIADNLYLSEHTIRTHVQNLRMKLNVRSKFEAAVLAMQVGGRQPGLAARMQF